MSTLPRIGLLGLFISVARVVVPWSVGSNSALMDDSARELTRIRNPEFRACLFCEYHGRARHLFVQKKKTVVSTFVGVQMVAKCLFAICKGVKKYS